MLLAPKVYGMTAGRRLCVPVLALVAGICLSSQELPRGRVIERVVCGGNEKQSYALYLPVAYSGERTWPILYCLDPGARGRTPVERFSAAAERHGFIVAGSNNSRNGSNEVVKEAIEWLIQDTHERFSIDDSHIYTAGFSGGARVALAWAGNGRVAGVIACGAGFSRGEIPKDVPFRIFATAGIDDFNYDEVYAMSRELSRRGVPVRFAEFSGNHEWLPENLTSQALDFMVGRLKPEPPPPESREQKRTAELYARYSEELEHGDDSTRRSIIHSLQKDSGRTEDGVARRVARRVLMGTFIGAAEEGRRLAEQKKYSDAARAWEVAVLARPANGQAWYALAVCRAAGKDKRGALDALGQAIANGFRDRDRLESEPLLDPLRKDPKFIELAGVITK